MKILQVEAEGASLEELEAIKIALEKMATEILSLIHISEPTRPY